MILITNFVKMFKDFRYENRKICKKGFIKRILVTFLETLNSNESKETLAQLVDLQPIIYFGMN